MSTNPEALVLTKTPEDEVKLPEVAGRAETLRRPEFAAKYDVFISYCHKDNRWYDQIKNCQTHIQTHIRSLNLRCFLDETNISVGQEFNDEILAALRSSRVFIFFVSEKYLASEYITSNELFHIKSVFGNNDYLTVPVLVDDCRALLDDHDLETRKFVMHEGSLRALSELADPATIIGGAVTAVKTFYARQKSETVARPKHEQVDQKPKPSRRKSSQRIQVIGWRGIEPRDLYSNFSHSLAFLTTEMSLNTLPPLHFFDHRLRKSEARQFDVIYTDAEFISRYRFLDRIQAMDKSEEIKELFEDNDTLEPAIRKLFFPGAKPKIKDVYCVPIQFGFNEILINPNGVLHDEIKIKLSDNKTDWSYKDFEIRALLEDNVTKIAIWHWYLPALSQFFLSSAQEDSVAFLEDFTRFQDGADLSSDIAEKYQNLLFAFDEYMYGICKLIKENPKYADRIKICMNLGDVQRCLLKKSFKAGVVIGIGSSVLTGSEYKHIVPVVPIEGVLLWVNCAAAIASPNYKPAVELINHWISEATQEKMIETQVAYFGLPTRSSTLQKVLSDSNHAAHHAVDTLRKIYDQDAQQFKQGRVARRVLPLHDWGRWLSHWERFVRAAN